MTRLAVEVWTCRDYRHLRGEECSVMRSPSLDNVPVTCRHIPWNRVDGTQRSGVNRHADPFWRVRGSPAGWRHLCRSCRAAG